MFMNVLFHLTELIIFIPLFFLSALRQAANPFFKLLTMLMEFAGGPPGMPSFASYILQRIWEVRSPIDRPMLRDQLAASKAADLNNELTMTGDGRSLTV